jgi:hypothetical protein
MGARSILMPDVGEGVAGAEIVEWTVQVGDLVKESFWKRLRRFSSSRSWPQAWRHRAKG